MNFKKTLANLWRRPYVKHPLLGIAAAILLLILTLLVLRLYTRQGSEFEMPRYTEMRLEEVLEAAEEHNFQVVVSDSVYIATIQPHMVLTQSPQAGAMLKRGRRIFLSINALRAPLVAVPSVIDDSFRQALIELGQKGLVPGILRFTTAVPGVRVNHLAVRALRHQGMLLPVGDSLPKGSLVDIDIDFDPRIGGEEGTVPDLRNLTLSEARAQLARSYFNTGSISYDATCRDEQSQLEARVASSYPEAKAKRKLGSAINLTLTRNEGAISSR